MFEKCKENIDCYVNAEFEASICDTVDEICKCNPDFYQREHRTCRRKGKGKKHDYNNNKIHTSNKILNKHITKHYLILTLLYSRRR